MKGALSRVQLRRARRQAERREVARLLRREARLRVEEGQAERRESAAFQDQLRVLQAQLQLEERVLWTQIQLESQARALRAHQQLPASESEPLRTRLLAAPRFCC